MEAMRKLTDSEVQTIDFIINAAGEAFVPLLTARKAQIASTPKKTFKYGSTERHKLDVYFPAGKKTSAPILFFLYGGAFVTGSRDLVPELVYNNVGAFFAQRGIITIIPDYRLAPETKYPGPSHDVREAVDFVLSSKQVDLAGNGGDKDRVYLMGHSAGAAIALSLFLDSEVISAEARSVFKGIILSGGAYGSAAMFSPYYGEENAESKTPLGLLKRASGEEVKRLPRLLFVIAQRDLSFVSEWDASTKKLLLEKGNSNFQEYVMQDHNHISCNLALSSGEGDEWANEVVKWIEG